MKTKREVLKTIIKEDGFCSIHCEECSFYKEHRECYTRYLKKIGAMAILRMFPEKEKSTLSIGTEIKFKNGECATLVRLKKEYWLMFENRCEKLDYLIGRTWEIVE